MAAISNTTLTSTSTKPRMRGWFPARISLRRTCVPGPNSRRPPRP